MTTPTRNPIPSGLPQDFLFNIEKVDEIVTSDQSSYVDRFGNSRFTWHGIESGIESIITSLDTANFTFPTISAGLSATTNGQYFRVPQGENANPAFIYYRNQSGTAVIVAQVASSIPYGYQKATTVGGTANAISLTIPGVFVDGTMVFFTATTTNTGAATVAVTRVSGASSTSSLLKEGNSPLAAGDIAANNPALIVYRGAPSNNWILVASGGAATSLANSIRKLEANSLAIISSVAMASDAYTGTNANTTTSSLLINGRVFLFVPSAANTTRTPSLSINGWTARTIKASNGGSLNPGDLAAGYPYLFMYNSAASDYRVMTFPADRARILGAYTKGTVTSDASSPNAISITIDGNLIDGTQITFEPVTANTGPVTVLLTDKNGNTGTRTLVKGANTALTGSELEPFKPAAMQWRGAPVNNLKLLFAGDVRTDILKLQDGLSILQGATPDPYQKFAKKLIGDGTSTNQSPFGNITFNNGVKAVTKKRIISTSIGSSVGVAAGTSAGNNPTNPRAPNSALIESLRDALGGYGEFDFINDNQCIPTQALQQFDAQLNNSPYFTSLDPDDWPDFVVIVGGMNDAPVGNFNMGKTFYGQQNALSALIDRCQDKGCIVIICTTPHHNVESSNVLPVNIPGDGPLLWPFKTYNVLNSYTFDATAKTIYNVSTFANAGYGGHILVPGHKLSVQDGVNAGTYTITEISTDRKTITVSESIPSSSTYSTTIKHVNLNAIAEDVLAPPPSRSFITKDWSGNGVETTGDSRFDVWNNMARTKAREKGAFVAECEIPFFKFGVEVSGWSSLFTPPNYNHPNDFGYDISYVATLKEAGRKISRLIFETKNYIKD